MNSLNRQELINLLFSHLEAITLVQATGNLFVSLVCAVTIYFIYFITSKEARPTASFAKTIVIITLSVTLVVMLIGSNLALSLGMVGALSVIRFRAAVKDSRDAAFIFFAIASGMASALGIYLFALLGVLFISMVIIILSFFKIGSQTYLLTVKTTTVTPLVMEELDKIAGRKFNVISVSSKQYDSAADASITETIYAVGIKSDIVELCNHLAGLDEVISATAVLREDV